MLQKSIIVNNHRSARNRQSVVENAGVKECLKGKDSDGNGSLFF
ncbi:MAG: hypothetical protein ACRC10_11620 [Thermoguttaceae bacterium]